MRVLDASVLVKLVTEEPGSEQARALIAVEPELAAPQLAALEIAGALSKKVRYHGLPLTLAHDALATYGHLDVEIVPDAGLIARAMEISVAMSHAIQDCLYLALAEALRCALVTADHKFAAKRQLYQGPAEVELLL